MSMGGTSVQLPDGQLLSFDSSVTALEAAAKISARLAKKTVAAKVNGCLVDATAVLPDSSELVLITAHDDDGVEVIRHSAAHVLAQAVKRHYPQAQITIGPVIDQGFYYDIAYGERITEDDLPALEATMSQIIKEAHPISRKVVSRAEAISLFREKGEHYKVEIIESLPEDEPLSLYIQGDFVDLCRGPHVPTTGHIAAFKLTSVAGAYWRGDANNEMLQRIYGTAWPDKQSLDAYLKQRAEAEKRDHRRLGKAMDLFHFDPIAPGMVFWHPNGWALNHQIRQCIRRVTLAGGYEEINTPQLVDVSLWQRSGHTEKFADDMFHCVHQDKTMVVKPMSCPCHVQVFNQGLRSYRSLPLRYAEFGIVHRNEASGTLHGLMRVRAMVQDDGHIFCTPEQLQSEVSAFIQQVHQVYRYFGFTDIIHKLSTRPDKRIGSDQVWDDSESALATALDDLGVSWEELPGEGAFYGPKIEFSLRDSIGRIWQCGTIQVDYSIPERLGAVYVGEDGEKHHPVMLHRAIVGSIERFTGILIEHYAGAMPLWLAPVQVVIATIADDLADYAVQLQEILLKNGIRVQMDLRNEKISYKIREHAVAKVPYVAIVGRQERDQGTVALRRRDGEQQTLSADTWVAALLAECEPGN